jgi:hypothetical protein
MGVSKAAGDALALAALLRESGNDVASALPGYSAQRLRFGRAAVAHARGLGAYLEACAAGAAAAAERHTPEAVMRDIAVTRAF